MLEPQARILELRLRFRRNPEARMLVDRCLMLLARAIEGDADMTELDRELTRLTDDLALRFGAPGGNRAAAQQPSKPVTH